MFLKKRHLYYLLIGLTLLSYFIFKNPYISSKVNIIYILFPQLIGKTFDLNTVDKIIFDIGALIIPIAFIIELIIKRKNEGKFSYFRKKFNKTIGFKSNKEPISNSNLDFKENQQERKANVTIIEKIRLRISKIQKKTIILEIIYFVALLFFIIYFIVSNNLISMQYLTDNDYPYHFLYIWWYKNIGLPYFGGNIGYFNQYYAGIPFNNYFTPGTSVIYYIISIIIPMSITNFLKLIILFFLIFYFFLPRILSKMIGLSRILSIVASSMMVFNSYLFVDILHGEVPYLISITLLMLNIIVVDKIVIDKMYLNYKKLFSDYRFYFVFLNFGFMTFIHFTSGILFGAFMIIIFAKHMFNIKIWKSLRNLRNLNDLKNNENLKNLWKLGIFFVLISIFAVLLIAGWWVPTIRGILSGIQQQQQNYLSQSFTTENFIIFKLGPIITYTVSENWSFLIMTIIGIYYCLKSKNQFEKDLTLFVLVILAFIFVFSFNISSIFINSFTPSRFLLIYTITQGIFVAKFLQVLTKWVKKHNIFAKNFIKNKNLISVRHITKRKKVILFNVTFIIIVLVQGIGVIGYRGTNIKMTQGLNQEVENTLEWISTNYKQNYNQSRILMEDSSYLTNLQWSGGYNQAYLSTMSNVSIIGGFQGQIWEKWTVFSSCIDGEAFNTSFNKMTLPFFVQKLNEYNINFLILWSNSSIHFVNKYPSYFIPVGEIGEFHLYNYTNPVNSYISVNGIYNNSQGRSWNLVHFDPNYIEINFRNITKGDNFTFSLYNYFNWRIYENGKLGYLNKNFELMQYTFKDSGNVNIVIKWQKEPYENITSILSYIILTFGIVMPVSLIIKNIFQKKFENKHNKEMKEKSIKYRE